MGELVREYSQHLGDDHPDHIRTSVAASVCDLRAHAYPQ